jgi:hypothetical protein
VTKIATHIYHAFFYRGLARIPETPRRPACDYDYACVLAYDVTPDGSMRQARGISQGAGWSLGGGGNLYGRVRV